MIYNKISLFLTAYLQQKLKTEENPENDGEGLDVFRAKESNSDDTDIMASHMHDLSFMLETSL